MCRIERMTYRGHEVRVVGEGRFGVLRVVRQTEGGWVLRRELVSQLKWIARLMYGSMAIELATLGRAAYELLSVQVVRTMASEVAFQAATVLSTPTLASCEQMALR